MKRILPFLAGSVVLFVAWAAWEWGFCRFYVPPQSMAILIAKTGKTLEPGQILARKGQRGILEDVLGEGRHFRNPFLYEWQIVPIISIPAGKIGLVTSKVGKELASGEFLAGEGEKGIRRSILGPGKYRINPQGYSVELYGAIIIPIGYVGVITSLDGAAPSEGVFAGPHERGVRKDVLQPGLYYINPKQYKIDILEIGINQISLLQESETTHQQTVSGTYVMSGKNIEFPSKDGFEIKMDTTIEFELSPDDIPATFSKYGNLEAVVDKIILPQILSISRLKGSAYGAKDFIVGEGREKFQSDFTNSLEETLQSKNIEIRSALIRHVTVPDQILQPIQAASVAQLRNLTNIEKQTTAKKFAELNTERTLIDQKREQIEQETKKLRAEIKAQQDKEVAEITAGTQKKVAEIQRDTSVIKADTVRKLGKIDADIKEMLGEVRAEGFSLMVSAFKDPKAYNFYEFALALPKDMKVGIAYAGPGTLWTDLKNSASSLGNLRLLDKQNTTSSES